MESLGVAAGGTGVIGMTRLVGFPTVATGLRCDLDLLVGVVADKGLSLCGWLADVAAADNGWISADSGLAAGSGQLVVRGVDDFETLDRSSADAVAAWPESIDWSGLANVVMAPPRRCPWAFFSD